MLKCALGITGAVVALAVGSAAASAQAMRPVAASRPSFGIIAGGSFATLTGDDVGDVDRRTGFMGGVYADLPLGAGGFSIQPRLLYSMSGAKVTNFDGQGTDGTLKMNYVRVPVMLRYTFSSPGGVRPFFSFGPSLGIQVGCKLSVDNGGSSASATCDDINTELGGGFEHTTLDLSGDVEFGLEFPAGRTHFSVGGMFSQGFTNTFKDANVRNQALSVFAAIGF